MEQDLQGGKGKLLAAPRVTFTVKWLNFNLIVFHVQLA
jgi:hypothetical protein